MDKQEILKFGSLFPEEVTVSVRRSEDGGFSAEILSYTKTFTEADTFSELIEMINDALYTYFEVPEKYISYMPTYLPPVNMVSDLMGFPINTGAEKFKLELAGREANRS